jgi:glutamine amidotransferase
MRAVIIDYGSGNLRSAAKAFERVVADFDLNADVLVTAEAAALRAASHVVLPGVGAFADCMAGLRAVPGMVEALEENVHRGGKPFLGICVGMQLMAERGHEHGVHPGLGWIAGDVGLMPVVDDLKVPHMGWNEIVLERPQHPLVAGIKSGDHAYFVHSYCFVPPRDDPTIATAEHGVRFAAIIGRDNMVGTQFHPEKSQAVGLRLIANFLRWRP